MEILDSIITFLIQAIFWYIVFSFLLGLIIRYNKNKEENLTELKNKLDEIVHRVQVEQHGEVYYWFDADDNEFLAQGKDVEEVVTKIKQRFPNHIFFLASKDKAYKISGPDWLLTPINGLSGLNANIG